MISAVFDVSVIACRR